MFRTPKLDRKAARGPVAKPPLASAGQLGGLFASDHTQGAHGGLQGAVRYKRSQAKLGKVDFRGPGPSGMQKKGK